jgi:hypothetical protein
MFPGIFFGECEAVHESRSPIMRSSIETLPVADGRSRHSVMAVSQQASKPGRLIIRSYVLEVWLHVYGRARNNRIVAGTRVTAIPQDQSGYHAGLRFRSGGDIVVRLGRYRISSFE